MKKGNERTEYGWQLLLKKRIVFLEVTVDKCVPLVFCSKYDFSLVLKKETIRNLAIDGRCLVWVFSLVYGRSMMMVMYWFEYVDMMMMNWFAVWYVVMCDNDGDNLV